MNGLMNFENLKENFEMRSYFQSEYKTDWEVNYYNFIAEAKAKRRQAIKDKLSKFFGSALKLFRLKQSNLAIQVGH